MAVVIKIFARKHPVHIRIAPEESPMSEWRRKLDEGDAPGAEEVMNSSSIDILPTSNSERRQRVSYDCYERSKVRKRAPEPVKCRDVRSLELSRPRRPQTLGGVAVRPDV